MPLTISMFFYILIYVIIYQSIIFRQSDPFPYGKRKLLLARAGFGTVPYCCYLFALKHIPLGDVSMFRSSTALFACIHGRIFLKEPIKKMDVLNIAVVLLGIILIVQPPIIFGSTSSIYQTNQMALYSALAVLFGSAVLEPIKNVCLRSMKGMHISLVVNRYVLL